MDIEELYPEECHAKDMWKKYIAIGPDTDDDARRAILSEMKAMQTADEEARGDDAAYDASLFWGAIGLSHSNNLEWQDAEECFRRQLLLLERIRTEDEDPLWNAMAVRAFTLLLEALGMNDEKSTEDIAAELREIWDTVHAMVEAGWDDSAFMDMDDLYWLPRRKEMFMTGTNVALMRNDRESALRLLTEFLSTDSDMIGGDTWDDVYSELLEMAVLQLRLAEQCNDGGDALLEGIHWLDRNSSAIIEHASEIEYDMVPHLIHFYTTAGSVWQNVANDTEKADELWTAGLEITKELYREDETLSFDGLKAQIELFRELSDRHRSEGRYDESYNVEVELRKMLECIAPHLDDAVIRGERVSNGMYLGSFAEDRKDWDEMLSCWTYALENLLDVDGSEEWARNVYKVLREHWQDAGPMFSDPEKMQDFIGMLSRAGTKFS